MQKIQYIFCPLIGQMAWSVRRGAGSFLALEFGRSHLQVREPRKSESESQKVKENAAQRRVFIHGQWHLLIMNVEWNISVTNKACNCDDEHSKVDDVLRKIDGQILTAVHYDLHEMLPIFEFDLGGIIRLVSSKRAKEGDFLWSLSHFDDGYTVACLKNGELVSEQSEKFDPGSIGIMGLAQ
jgi:hypothetical protein